LEQNIGAVALELTPEDLDELDPLSERVVGGRY
jgi:hypothetical protein